ncbi:hypothetical protein [Iningainema tapete]|uniref:Uncharacterized protein n=1 Tax=Iningainema tapete BLCC-T55 TaxID=2748662 RepID=A0A8J6XHQ3_9CYAN|nr:hypothetical protein [Iningainema tapete]MBD2776139.1 hypothetical protein [Iningainema tapete BLCC-T55]
MLKIGDYAHHQTTGQVGQVVAYGHQVLDGVYQTTLTVRMNDNKDLIRRSTFIEDVYSVWVLANKTEIAQILFPQAA